MTELPVERTVENWYPTPKNYRKSVRDSAFDTGQLIRQGKKWKLIGPKSDKEPVTRERCCFEVPDNTGGICGADIEGKKRITTNEVSQVLSTPTKTVYIERLVPLCSNHKDLI